MHVQNILFVELHTHVFLLQCYYYTKFNEGYTSTLTKIHLSSTLYIIYFYMCVL